MIPRDPRRRRRLVPIVSHLESRRLLSIAASSASPYGQIGVDLVGPDASQGGDGIQDLDVHLTGLLGTSTVDRILVTQTGLQEPWDAAPGSVAWETQPTPNNNNVSLGEYGYSMAEFFLKPGDSSQGDLFINPQVREVAAAAGTALPGGGVSLGGSTGTLTTIQNNQQFEVWVYYQGGSTDSCTYTVSNLTSATDPMPAIATPSSAAARGMAVQDLGQSTNSVVSWNSQQFYVGPIFTNGGVQGLAQGQIVYLPQGYFTTLQLLGTATGGSKQSNVQFEVNYATGSPTPFTQTFSDWKKGYTGTGGTTAPGELLVATMTSYNTRSGNTSGNVYLYGYTITLDSTRVVASITFPSNVNIDILAIDEVNSAQQLQQVILGGALDTSSQENAAVVQGATAAAVDPGSQEATTSTGSPDLVSMALEELAAARVGALLRRPAAAAPGLVAGPVTTIANLFGDSLTGAPSVRLVPSPFASARARSRFAWSGPLPG